MCLSSTTLSTPGNKTAAQSHHKNVPMASVTAPFNLLRPVLGFWQRAPAPSDPMFALSNMLGADEGQGLQHGESLADT